MCEACGYPDHFGEPREPLLPTKDETTGFLEAQMKESLTREERSANLAAFCDKYPGLKVVVNDLDTWPARRDGLTTLLRLAVVGGYRLGLTKK
jgi:hypothetical protein